MNAFNKAVLDNDETGLMESCDCCNRLLQNWHTMGDLAFLNLDGKILCPRCRLMLDTLKNCGTLPS